MELACLICLKQLKVNYFASQLAYRNRTILHKSVQLFGICNTGLKSELQGNMMESQSFDLNKQKGVDVAINKKNN